MARNYCVTYSHTIVSETTVEAENEKEAKKKFKAVMPYEKIEEVWEIDQYAE